MWLSCSYSAAVVTHPCSHHLDTSLVLLSVSCARVHCRITDPRDSGYRCYFLLGRPYTQRNASCPKMHAPKYQTQFRLIPWSCSWKALQNTRNVASREPWSRYWICRVCHQKSWRHTTYWKIRSYAMILKSFRTSLSHSSLNRKAWCILSEIGQPCLKFTWTASSWEDVILSWAVSFSGRNSCHGTWHCNIAPSAPVGWSRGLAGEE